MSKITIGAETFSNEKTILAHAENEKLEACEFFPQDACKTKLYLVTRGSLSESPSLQKKNAFELSSKNSLSAPFVREPQTDAGGER